MEQPIYPIPAKELAQKRKDLAPELYTAFQSFSQHVFADGALPAKTRDLIAIAVTHVTRCPYCIRGHTKRAIQKGVTEQEIMEAIWVTAEMRAGGAVAHSALAINKMNQENALKPAK